MSTQSAASGGAAVRTAGPRSAVSEATGLVGLAGFCVAILATPRSLAPGLAGLVVLAYTAAPMILWSVLVDRVHLNPTTGVDWTSARSWEEAWETTRTKLLGLYVTWALIGLVYAAVRWPNSGRYDFSFAVLAAAIIPMSLLAIPYLAWVDRFAVKPRDGLWSMGCLVLGRWSEVEGPALKQHLLSWTVKGFFLAFMLSILPNSAGATLHLPEELFRDLPITVGWIIGALFFVDVCFGTIGYICTFRPLDSHIQSPNPYALGWLAALICYPPFAIMGGNDALYYKVGTRPWFEWLGAYPVLLVMWAAALVALVVIYAWATMIFGLRFSNLTYRGTITNGPYRLFKHPAYLSKNLFWWLSVLPFLTTAGPVEAARNCALLLAVNGIYLLRARTEEKHLMQEPSYREYAAWIAEHGLIPRLARRIAPRAN